MLTDDPPCLVEMPAAAYHADPCPRPSLSASVATVLVRQSPLHAWLKHPRLGGLKGEATREMDRGTILHALVLGTPCPVVSIAADDYRKRAAQEARDAARAEGKVPVLAREYDDLLAVADATLSALKEQGVALSGVSERVLVWEEEAAAGRVLCRGMIDHLVPGEAGAAVYDLKFSRSAHPKACAAHAVEYGCDVQCAAYTSGLGRWKPELAGRVEWRWLFVEELPAGSPKRVAVTVARPEGALKEFGESRWRRAVETWAVCLLDDHWPAYAEGEVSLEVPAWALKEELGV